MVVLNHPNETVKERISNNAMENDSERIPEIQVTSPGFNSTLVLEDAKSFDYAVQLLNTLKQKEHGEALESSKDTGTGFSEEEIVDAAEGLLDDIQDSINTLYERVTKLEERVDSIHDPAEIVDKSRIDELEDTLQQVLDRTNGLEASVIDEEVPTEPETEESEETSEAEKTTGQETDGKSDEEVDCPQCGKGFASVDSLPAHTSRSRDHVNISEFFTSEDGKLECPICNQEFDEVSQFSIHFREEHETSMTQYYVNHFDDLNLSRSKVDKQKGEKHASKCKECGETFHGSLEEADRKLDEHYIEKHSDEESKLEADNIPDLIDEGVIELDPPYSYDEFKHLDKIEQAAALYLAGKEIREGDVAEYADMLLKADVSSTSQKEAQYVYRLLTVDMEQHFEKGSTENTFGTEKTVYRLIQALPAGVEELQVTGWTVDELEELPDIAVSEIVLEALNETGPATLEDVQDHILVDDEKPNHQIKRVLNNYLAVMLDQWREGKTKKYALKDDVRDRLEENFLSFYQATQKKVSGRSQYICEDCGEVFDGSKEAKKHRRKEGHLNWDRRNHLPWRGN